MSADRPILYSFRRCPYAIRARMALLYSGASVELREVILREIPQQMLACSPKGTVPVMVLPDGRVIEESRDIMTWTLAHADPHHWLPADPQQWRLTNALVDENDGSFKQDLDRYKYAVRFPEHPPEHYRACGERFLQKLELLLQGGEWLAGNRMGFADVAIFPFVRQFAHVDMAWFDATAFIGLQAWLGRLVDSALFGACMRKYPQWHAGDPVTVFPDPAA